MPTEVAVDFAQVRVERGGLGPQRHGPDDQFHGPAVMAALMVHHPEPVQGVGVVRHAGQPVMVAPRRIGIAAGLVKFQGRG